MGVRKDASFGGKGLQGGEGEKEGGREGERACDRQARGKTTSRRSCLVLARSLRRRPNDRLGPPQLERTEGKEERREKGRKRQGTGEGRDEEGRVARREGWRGGEREGKRVARPRIPVFGTCKAGGASRPTLDTWRRPRSCPPKSES